MMDRWQPLAPNKRASGHYARANNPGVSLGTDAMSRLGDSLAGGRGRKTADETAAEERRAEILQGPVDPFPPVGPFPQSVAVRILSFLSLHEQRNCALAGRALARAVADEANWRRRLDALDWCMVDGLKVELDQVDGGQEAEREIGRRRKGKEKASEKSDNEPPSRDSAADTSSEKPAVDASRPQASPTASLKPQTTSEEDDFGDFAGPSTTKDAFGDFNFEKLSTAGGSLASGMASVAMGGGRPHNFSANGAPSFTPLAPAKAKATSNSKRYNPPLPPTARPPNGSLFSYSSETSLALCSASSSFRRLRAYAKALRPFVRSLADPSAPASTSLLFTCDLGSAAQTALLSNILRFLSTSVGGNTAKRWKEKSIMEGFEDDNSIAVRAQDAAHRLLNNLLSSFEGILARRGDALRASAHGADTARAIRRAEEDMRLHASGVWELGNARLALAISEGEGMESELEDQFGRMQAAKAFLQHCQILDGKALQQHDALANVQKQDNGTSLDFTPMDRFMADVLEVVKTDGQIIARVFPPEQDVLLAYADRVAQDVVGGYVSRLLDYTHALTAHLYLRSCAATFAQSWKMVDELLAIEPRDQAIVTQTRCEDVVFQAWERHVEEYLSVELAWVRQEMQGVTDQWDNDVKNDEAKSHVDAAFLTSQNPAAVKRSVLSGFKDVLLLPVTVVPRTAGIVGGAVIRTAGSGLSTLNPLRWQSGGANSGQKSNAAAANELARPTANGANTSTASLPRNDAGDKGYMDFSGVAVGNMDSDEDEDSGPERDFDDQDEWNQEVAAWSAVASTRPPSVGKVKKTARKQSPKPAVRPTVVPQSPAMTLTKAAPSSVTHSPRTGSPVPSSRTNLTKMQLLLSLDTALQVIHINRDCLKRLETFKRYPTPFGERVRDAIQQVSLMLFRALGEGHIAPGFEKATHQIQEWRPNQTETGTGGADEKESGEEVEPLVHFFELVHVGDTIAQMVQVYFDQEMALHIDRNDFLDPVVKGRKRFEGALDEAVARGLNAGVDLLLGQAEHILVTRQEPSDYNPPKGQLADLSPTRACREVVECLKVHCKMLVGSTDKSVLEVFYQEVGIRLHALLGKRLKRQQISLDGGFRVIADLNEYYAFIVTLRQPSITADFESLKMLGNLYIIDNPKELAKLARDANNFGGSLSPEDLYEFLQARADFRSIEKAIDKEMYGFKASEDCCIC